MPADASRPTRLLVVSPLYPTADRPEVGPFVARRVQGLRARGVDVAVVASRAYHRSALVRHVAILRRALAERGPVDGVESHVLFPAGLVGLAAARLRRRPLVVYAHGADVALSAQRSPLHRALASLVARSADAVVTNSAATARHVRVLGRDPVVIPPGVDMARFRPGDQDASRRRLGLPAGALIALYLGGLSRRKGADIFARALAASPRWTGVLVGDGELRAAIDAVDPALRLVGAVRPEEVVDWIVAADVVVVPSRDEPLGLAAIEALACGRPIVASRTGGLAEVVLDGVNGIAVAPGDPEPVAAALVRLEDRSLRESLGAASRASVAAHASTECDARMAAVWGALGVQA